MLGMVAQRGAHKSVCPSEIAKALAPLGWRELMPTVRDVAWQLREQGLLNITQGGVPVANRQTVRGPIRLRQRPSDVASDPTGETP